MEHIRRRAFAYDVRFGSLEQAQCHLDKVCDRLNGEASNMSAQEMCIRDSPSASIRCGIVDNALYLDEVDYRTGLLSSDIIKTLRPWGCLLYTSRCV